MPSWQRLQPRSLHACRDLRRTTPRYAHVQASCSVGQSAITREPFSDAQMVTGMLERPGGYIAARELSTKAYRNSTGVAQRD
ncbi:hypothetical protein E6O75_ATG08515 [Venturia nashicola]|uniref:Uncharacterized protein n=1 Tax=Venturia nashicola TaxID=86259 RepID=A0A4Z1NVG5_9PEZI|nr:hypothetical protein E6O75_ATG08515 [Venturia nashicola]